MAPSKAPCRSGSPAPRSARHRSPSTSRSRATSSIASLMSMPWRPFLPPSGLCMPCFIDWSCPYRSLPDSLDLRVSIKRSTVF